MYGTSILCYYPDLWQVTAGLSDWHEENVGVQTFLWLGIVKVVVPAV